MRPTRSQAAVFAAILAASLLASLAAGWLGPQVDNSAYDWTFRHHPPRDVRPVSMLLTIDEESLSAIHGMAGLRPALAAALQTIAPARPAVVAIDLILADEGEPAGDAALEAAMAAVPRLVLACDLVDSGRRWEDPIPRFQSRAAAIGHVHGDPGPVDGVSRIVPLAKAAGHNRRWALSLEAFRQVSGAPFVLESPDDLEVAGTRIPAKAADSRALYIRYLPASAIPRVSLAELRRDPTLASRFRGKVVFAGVTAQSAMRDRMLTPYSDGAYMPGIEILANIFETLDRKDFLVPASNLAVALASLLLAALAVSAFAFRTGWQAYLLAAIVLVAAHAGPYLLFGRGIVFPYVAPASAAWLAAVGAGSFQFVTVRRRLGKSEAETARYQQAMHFVTHEMRTPLTAIQGSSELMTRYKLSEDKRKQIAELITSESKRLARMIETFLSVERLSAGEMELKREPFDACDVVEVCLARVRPIADRKQIRISTRALEPAALAGDRELMEYAVYNLLTNAVKYSSAGTEVTVSVSAEGSHLRIAVADQGIGMDQNEVKRIFQKFYRTNRAVASGERGTGIGLSIVEQIVTSHGGRIKVTSAPGKGSCFTLVLPALMGERAARAPGQGSA